MQQSVSAGKCCLSYIRTSHTFSSFLDHKDREVMKRSLLTTSILNLPHWLHILLQVFPNA